MVQSSNEQNSDNKYVDSHLEKNVATIRKILGNSADLVIRKSSIGCVNHQFAIIYIKGLINEELVKNNILRILELNKKNIESNLLLRLLRIVSFYMTLFLPALYVALVSYHPECFGL